MHEVVVTGIGMITPLGTTAAESVHGFNAGTCSSTCLLPELANTPLADAPVAMLPEFDPAARLGGRRMLKYMSHAAMLGCMAAREAVKDAEAVDRFAAERIGLYAGTGLATADPGEVERMIQASLGDDGLLSCSRLGSAGLPATNPLLSFKILANMPACLISILEGIKGPNLIFTPWEGHTASGILEAWLAVQCGEVDCAVTGAADHPTHPATFVYLRQSGFLDLSEVPASGAAYLVFEREETARRDSRRIYASISDMHVRSSELEGHDTLSRQIGRTFAAAPAILLAIACMQGDLEVLVRGTDRQEFYANVSCLVEVD